MIESSEAPAGAALDTPVLIRRAAPAPPSFVLARRLALRRTEA